MVGQFSLFDEYKPIKRKPCEYAFKRYIGQKVRDRHGIHVIAEIEKFYTVYTDRMVGTPYDMVPTDKKEYTEMIESEIEYYEYLTKSECDTNRSQAKRNLQILYEKRKELNE